MPLSCIKPNREDVFFTLQVCISHYWYTDYDYATAIPADTGNTPGLLALSPAVPVYPRWRGEHSKCISLFMKCFL
ncbi:hypothetical protein FPE89_15025 [Salmonella enterica subsp. diarizonae]|nr:hypothetical protein [Salmonella enterica subsp. diarizonae]EDA1103219.1 hypothetical protein [Salmonella enterica subsp. diarizonae]